MARPLRQQSYFAQWEWEKRPSADSHLTMLRFMRTPTPSPYLMHFGSFKRPSVSSEALCKVRQMT